jgi:hypothetical protein
MVEVVAIARHLETLVVSVERELSLERRYSRIIAGRAE